jgi:protein subunit release factor B
MCYTKRDRELEKEARWVTESRLMEEEARKRHEDHQRRRREHEQTPLIEKVKEVVGVR